MDTKNLNLIDLFQKFGSDEACRQYIEHIRWPDGVRCPRCDNASISRIHDRGQFDCNSCRYQFSVTSGTVLHDTHLPLSKWFATVYLMIEGKKGVSALEIKRSLNMAYKTAWYLCHRIRSAMRDAYPMPLKGRVEIDETWVGGKVKGKGQGYKGNKALVVGAVQRGGKVILKVEVFGIHDKDAKTQRGSHKILAGKLVPRAPQLREFSHDSAVFEIRCIDR